MKLIDQVERYQPMNEQEEMDQKAIAQAAKIFQQNILYRENLTGHVTSSAFVVNPAMDHVLLVYHKLRGTWSWPGGHADGEENLLQVAVNETKEETGVQEITPLSEDIISVDVFAVDGHMKNGSYVNAHLHYSVAYVLICEDQQPLRINKKENSAVKWCPFSFFETFSPADRTLYQKIIKKIQWYQMEGENES